MAAGSYEVRSVSRAIGILNVLEQVSPNDPGLTVSDISRIAGGQKSTVFATLQTLLAHGLVADSGAGMSRRYRLGLGLTRLGERAAAQTPITALLTPAMHELSRETGLTARAAVLDPEGWAVVIARVDAPHAVRLDLRLGQLERPHCTGLGKALLALMPDEEVRDILARLGTPMHTPRTLGTVDAVIEHLAEIREAGYAVDDGEDAVGITCVAAAIAGRDGRPMAALSVTGLTADDTMRRPDLVGQLVHKHAASVTPL